MLRKLHDLIGYNIEGVDETIGSIDDFYFDDHSGTVRYVVVDTGSWLVGRRVLISTEAIQDIDTLPEAVRLNLTKEQIENSPSIDSDQPVSREHEVELHQYYGWPGYWTVSPLVGMPLVNPAAVAVPAGAPEIQPVPEAKPAGSQHESTTPDESTADAIESNLRSVREVTGYNIHATDGDIGHVSDIFAGEEDWVIRYFLVDTRNWWPGKHVLIARDWVKEIQWADRSLAVTVTKEQIKESPEYDPQDPIDRGYETTLYDYYLTPGYWL